MRKILFGVLVGAFLGSLGVVVAQTPTIFANIRVNGFSDLRGDIVNNTGDVTVNDNLVVTGTCTGCGGVTFPIEAPDGSQGAPSYSFSSGGGTAGMWYDSFDDFLAIQAPGTGGMFLHTPNGELAIQGATMEALIDGDIVFTTGPSNMSFNIGDGAFGVNVNDGAQFSSQQTNTAASIFLQAQDSIAETLASVTIDGAGTVDITGDTSVDNLTVTGTCTGCGGLTQTTGSFVATFDNACTTSPTITFDYVQTGDQVIAWTAATSGFPCTGDVVGFSATGAPVPVGIRPASTAVRTGILNGATDNGAQSYYVITFTTGGIVTLEKCTSTPPCSSVGWTAAGNRSLTAGSWLAYGLGNP